MICVAGMPRSGTSLVTQLLHRCGMSLGPPGQLMPASVNNTDGYWENMRFVQLNERLLAANGGTWFAPSTSVRATPEITADARTLIAQFEGQEPWGWKDPRNAVTLLFWKSLLPGMKVLVCVRHPAETASSLVASTLIPRTWQFYWSVARSDSPMRLNDGPAARPLHQRLIGAARHSMSDDKRRRLVYEVGLDLWRVYNERVLEETSHGERLVTHYEAVLANPRAELERILAFADIRVSAEMLDDISGVVSQRMRHQRANDVALPADIDALYARLSREARD